MYDYQDKKDEKKSEPKAKQRKSKEAKGKLVNQKEEHQKELALAATAQRKENKTGMPDGLKTGIENLSGISMDDVKVHYNSPKPAQLNAHAYAQGNQIHLGSGQEKHLAHEAWHVVQQKQGRVKPTATHNGTSINDNASLEKEADRMGGKATQLRRRPNKLDVIASRGKMIQRVKIVKFAKKQYPLFFKESFAGLLGYSSHYVMPPKIDVKFISLMDTNRLYFHKELTRLFKAGLAPRWAHQLMWQNAMQAKFGGDLPLPAAVHMIKYLELMGKEAQEGGDRIQLAKYYYAFQAKSIYPFEEGGSSLAPRMLHSMGVMLQMPMVFFGGKYWVNRSAQRAVMANPLMWIALAAAFTVLFGTDWSEKKDDKKAIEGEKEEH